LRAGQQPLCVKSVFKFPLQTQLVEHAIGNGKNGESQHSHCQEPEQAFDPS
jgi:hypothetical protein